MRYRLLALTLLIIGLFFFPWSSSSVVEAQTSQPNRLVVTRAPINSVQVTQLVSQVSLVQKIYNHLKVLPHEPVHQVCPLYVVGVYHLKFLHDTTTIEQTTYIQGGCALVILDQKDVRVPDTTFLNLLRQANILQSGSVPQGLAPADLQNAYDLQGAAQKSGQGQTVAIIDAYNNPNAERDLAHYRAYFNLPACTTANGCFKKMNQAGGTWLPQNDQGWSLEIALDLDMVSAICPRCHILLVEANTPSFQDLGHAVGTAIISGASIVSNSYGSTEDGMSNQFAHYYNHPGATIVASAGDSGYGVQAPAAYASVIAVGGTSLVQDQNTRGWSETAWSGTGSGCSAFVKKPIWQKDTRCAQRMGTDVSVVADPATGVAVYSTYGSNGWLRLGGTSASAPIVAGVYGLAGNAKTMTGQNLYSHPEGFYDVTSGNNGSCTPRYFCTAGPGYDGPTGLGTPHGLTAF